MTKSAMMAAALLFTAGFASAVESSVDESATPTSPEYTGSDSMRDAPNDTTEPVVEQKDDVKDAVRDTREDVKETRQEYSKRVRKDIDELGVKIDKLKEKTANATADERAAAKKDIAALKTKKRETEVKWKKFEKATDRDWEKFKGDLDTSLDDLRTSYDRFTGEVKSDYQKNKEEFKEKTGIGDGVDQPGPR